MFLHKFSCDGGRLLMHQFILRFDLDFVLSGVQGLAKPNLSLSPDLMAFQYICLTNYNSGNNDNFDKYLGE
jgi:hypothetical protein